jgi:hypothetical protein
VKGLNLIGNRFDHCIATGDLLISQSGTATQPTDHVLESNVFGCAWDNDSEVAFSIQTQDPTVTMPLDLVARNNLFECPPDWQGASGVGDPAVVVTNNIGSGATCDDTAGELNNIWTNRDCSASDVQNSGVLGSGFYVGSGAFDWRYDSDHPAIGFADPGTATATTAEGNNRDGDPDAGPYEYGVD